MNFQNINDFFQSYFSDNQTEGIIRLVFDSLIIIGLIVLFFVFIRQKISVWRLLAIFAGGLVIFFLAVLFKLYMLIKVMEYLGLALILFLVIIYSQDIKAALDGKAGKDRTDNSYSSEKEKTETIDVICNTCDYLSKRRIGALITFERKDSLEVLSSKAIPINATITQEILTTIFTPGTACHDGGVIIRNNRIACAGAYYELSDNYEIPKSLGTRHRAGIGISETTDSVTIIVSEETGNIRIAIAGNISKELEKEKLRELLSSYLTAK